VRKQNEKRGHASEKKNRRGIADEERAQREQAEHEDHYNNIPWGVNMGKGKWRRTNSARAFSPQQKRTEEAGVKKK